jgi:hypothetical protein
MKKLRFVSYFILVPLVMFSLIGGCGGGGTAPQKLVINANGPSTIDDGQSVQLTAAETNAATRIRAGEGMASRLAAATAAVSVTWAIKSGPGSLTNATSTSVTFCAGTLSGANWVPLAVNSPTQTVITATSTTNSNQTQSITITITHPPLVTTNALTTATEFVSYTLNLVAAGGAGMLTWSLRCGFGRASDWTNPKCKRNNHGHGVGSERYHLEHYFEGNRLRRSSGVRHVGTVELDRQTSARAYACTRKRRAAWRHSRDCVPRSDDHCL